MQTSDLVERRLSYFGDLTREVMEQYFPEDEPHRRIHALMADYPARPSKAIRPSLCLAACRAFGGDALDALQPAVAIELLHNAFLIHDDIQDESETRRGSPTLHETVGVPIALNTGDALAMLSFDPILDSAATLGTRLGSRLLDEFAATVRWTIDGQDMELGWRADNDLSVTAEDYLEMVLRKTCCYTTILPLRFGALIGTRGNADVDAISRFGFYLGAAFQVQDDVLNLVGQLSVYGKEIAGDIYEGKRSLPMIHLLENCEEVDRRFVGEFLGKKRVNRSPSEVDRVSELMVGHQSVEFAASMAVGFTVAARTEFDHAFELASPGPDLEFLEAMIPYMTERSL